MSAASGAPGPMAISPKRLGLAVFVSTSVRQEDMPENQCNEPATRRDLILAALAAFGKENLDVLVAEVLPPTQAPAPATAGQPVGTLAGASIVHDKAYLAFLETAWDRWKALEHRDDTFCSESDKGARVSSISTSRNLAALGLEGGGGGSGATPALVPGNGPNRDPCCGPGESVTSQCAWHCADREAPIYAGLAAALASDLGVARAALGATFEPSLGCSATLALTTHPGHHASSNTCAGYCYLNSAAWVARTMREEWPGELPKVAVLDVDYHAGNGTVGIFWFDPDVLVCSIHADPNSEYPYTCGFAHQVGGPGAEGATLNLPLAAGARWVGSYGEAIGEAVRAVRAFGARGLVVSLGVDTLRGDPVCVPGAGFQLELGDYLALGAALRGLELPTVFVQEGGYDLERCGAAVANTLRGFCDPVAAGAAAEVGVAAKVTGEPQEALPSAAGDV